MSILIEIPRRNTTCDLGQEPFVQGMDYYSILQENQEDKTGLIRKDFCAACWEKSERRHIHSHWKGKVPNKQVEARERRDTKSWALEMLKEALLKDDEDSQAEAFILALYLARKRHLFLRQELVRETGEVFFLYEVSFSEEMLAVKKMDLAKLQTAKIQQELAHKLTSSN